MLLLQGSRYCPSHFTDEGAKALRRSPIQGNSFQVKGSDFQSRKIVSNLPKARKARELRAGKEEDDSK